MESNFAIPTSLKKRLVFYPAIFLVFTTLSVLAAWYPIAVSTFTHVLFPVVVLVAFGMLTHFGYVKLSSLVFGRLLVILAALGWGDQHIHQVYLVIFQLNILEAVIMDAYRRRYFNAANGLLLLVTSFYLVLSWTGRYVAITNEQHIWWLLAYTLWNANFVTLELSGGYYIHHYLLLLSPILASWVLADFSAWLILRETSLTLGITLLACFKQQLFALENHPIYKQWFKKYQVFILRPKTQFLLWSVITMLMLLQLVLHT